MRTNLIMHFHCSECGKQLHLKNSIDGAKKPRYHYDDFGNQEPKEPTGAACYYTPKISIVPCKACIDKYTLPAKALTDAIIKISEINLHIDTKQ